MFKHELGKETEDIVTGFRGIIVWRCQYLTGCARYGVQPKIGKDGKPGEIIAFDENQLKITGKGVVVPSTEEQKKKGGPQPYPTK